MKLLHHKTCGIFNMEVIGIVIHSDGSVAVAGVMMVENESNVSPTKTKTVSTIMFQRSAKAKSRPQRKQTTALPWLAFFSHARTQVVITPWGFSKWWCVKIREQWPCLVKCWAIYGIGSDLWVGSFGMLSFKNTPGRVELVRKWNN